LYAAILVNKDSYNNHHQHRHHLEADSEVVEREVDMGERTTHGTVVCVCDCV